MDTKNLKENHFIVPPDEIKKFHESLKRKANAAPERQRDEPSFAEYMEESAERAKESTLTLLRSQNGVRGGLSTNLRSRGTRS